MGASSCYSSSEEEGKDNNNDDSEEEGEASEDEVEKEVSVEKEMTAEKETAQEAAASPAVAAEVVQEVDFEGKYQRFLQNEEMEEREDNSMTALITGYAEEKEENVGEKNEDKESDEPDFCL